ncbi:hypothetical protein T484DRAFT_1913528, partial [Baffinella frigidus]
MGTKRKKHGRGGGKRRGQGSVKGGSAGGEGGSVDSRGGGSGATLTPTDKGKRGRTLYEEGDGPATVTRGWIKTELDDQQTMKVREDLCAAIMRVYKGGTYGHPQELQFGWDEAVVLRMESSIRQQVPRELGDTSTDLSLYRAACRVSGVQYWGKFTEKEARECMYRAVSGVGGLNATELYTTYGLGKTHFFRLRKALVKPLGGLSTASNMSLSALRAAVDSFPFPKQGPPCYFEPWEMKVLFATAFSFKTVGDGWSPESLRARCKKILRSNAIEWSGGDSKKMERMLNAECSKKWLKHNLMEHAPELGGSTFMPKTMKKSLARARAKDPWLNTEMFKLIKAMYA